MMVLFIHALIWRTSAPTHARKLALYSFHVRRIKAAARCNKVSTFIMTTTSVPGLNLPTQTAMLAGNPRDSAIAAQTAANNKLAALNAAVGGGCSDPLGAQRPTMAGGGTWPMWIKPPSTMKRRRKHNYTQKRTRNRKRGRKHCRCTCPCHVCRNECKYRHNKRRHRTRGGATAAAPATATIQVPQFTMQYAPTGGPGQTPNDLIKQNSQISTQASANAVYDKYASQK
jgi:hypothetical protein